MKRHAAPLRRGRPRPNLPAGTPNAPPGKQWMTVKDALSDQKLLNAGRVKPAEALIRDVVKARPRHSDARNLFSVVLQNGRRQAKP